MKVMLCGLLFSLVCWAGLPAGALAGIAGPFASLDPLPDPAPRPPQNYEGAIAYDGTNWVMVWATDIPSAVMAIRMDASGRLADSQAYLITPNNLSGSAARRTPAVAAAGGKCLFVWHESQGGVYRLAGRCMTSAGQPLDLAAFTITNVSSSLPYPGLAADSNGYLLVWQTNSSRHVSATRLNAAGRPQGATFRLATNGTISSAPAVAWGNFSIGQSAHLAVWDRNNDIYGARITTVGALLDPVPLAICTNAGAQSEPAVAAGLGPGGQEGWWVLYTDSRSGAADIYGSFVNSAGVVGCAGTGMPIIATAGAQSAPAIAWDGTRYVIGWHDAGGMDRVGYSVMSVSGMVSDAAGSICSTNETTYNRLAAGMAGQLLDLHYFYDCQRATLLTRTADTLSIVTDRVVSVSGAFQTWPDGGFDGANCWAVWKRGSLGGQAGDDICAARFSPAGVVLDSPAIAVCATNQRQDYPAVACNTGRILAVWADARAGADQIWGQFLRPGGSLAGTNFPLGNAGTTFGAVASDGTNFLVAWEESGGSIGSRFVRANGTLSAVQTYGGDGDNPKVAFGSNVYLVVWEDGNNSIRARRYRSDETLLDALITIESGDSLYEPAIAYNPATNRFLVVWEDYPEVMGRIVDPGSGAVSSTLILVTPEEGLKVDPRVLYDGQTWVVTWADSTAANNYYAARVAGDGTLLDTNAMRILSRNSRILGAAASGAAGGPAWWLAHGIFYDNGANVYNAYRVFALPWQPGPQTNITPLVLTADQLPGNLARVQFTEPVPVCTNYVVETAVRVAGGWTAVSNGAIMVPNGVIGGIVCTNIPGGSAFYRVRGAR